MKNTILALTSFVSFASPLLAGTPTSVIAPSLPAPEPSPIWNWFIGGSAGYLSHFDEPLYAAQLGVDTPYRIGSWDTSLYLEVAYTEKDDSFSTFDEQLDEDVEYDTSVKIIPVTLNLKLERELTQRLNFYGGLGAGVAFINVDADSDLGTDSLSEEDNGFTVQLFAGLVYNITPHLEVFGGGRWIYIDTGHFPIAGHSTLKIHHDYGAEVGLRYNF